ncbi:MAG TPA: class I SAM-dependent methyltransferase [Opitutaceae bacterium]|jgi:S-adenosylmethionine-diacylgycerolhomoserine-N-methlytransferase|nr:class I SAM-dependent methyltransferase [Opitutaceae bacterium]
MNGAHHAPASLPAETAVEKYYRFHSRIYDATRWSFLFGRTAIINKFAGAAPRRILEIGCGTGRNLAELARRFPQAQITGVDLSATMLDLARKKIAGFRPRVQLLHQAYTAPLSDPPGYDLVLFSYALSMFNPGYDTALAAARSDLVPGGRIAVVDFHDSRFWFFERWMGVNHVRMNGQLRPILQSLFTPMTDHLCPAYAGTWRYLLFVGRKGWR